MRRLTAGLLAGLAEGGVDLAAADYILGTSAEIAAALYAHVAFREVTEVAFALPFTFEHEDYVQILTDMATRLFENRTKSRSVPRKWRTRYLSSMSNRDGTSNSATGFAC